MTTYRFTEHQARAAFDLHLAVAAHGQRVAILEDGSAQAYTPREGRPKAAVGVIVPAIEDGELDLEESISTLHHQDRTYVVYDHDDDPAWVVVSPAGNRWATGLTRAEAFAELEQQRRRGYCGHIHYEGDRA